MEPTVLAFLVAAIGAACWIAWPADKGRFALMRARRGSLNPVSSAVAQGYRQITKVSGKPFFVRYWQRDYMVLPSKYLPDVRRAGRDHLAFFETISDVMFLYNWVGDLFNSSRMTFSIIKGVNPQLPKLSHGMFQESLLAFEEELRLDHGESTMINALDVITAVSLRTMTRIIAGKDLSSNKAFLEATAAYFNGNFLTGFIMLRMPLRGAIRDLLAWPLYKYHQHFRQQRLIEMIKPVIAKRMEYHQSGNNANNRGDLDTIQCTLNLLDSFPLDVNAKDSPLHTLAHETLQLIWAAGQSPAISTTAVLFKMLEEPSYIAPLREEARAAVEKYGWEDPILNELPKLDSFIRETHRLYPVFTLNATRLVKGKPFTFSDGFTVPPGTRIAFPAEECQKDSDFISNPQEFDGFRFIKLAATDARQEDGVSRWAASHASFSNLTFGYGNHACPGRFIAIRLLKVLLTRLLLEYEFSWDVIGEPPPRFVLEGISFPNVGQRITVRRPTKSS
ncbi:Uu.00g118270.m01.CDS01 [Anthostomella pinea]|uniref:Uu.00g118270.m01.CDS01 n=1 Tax=Anthostomella pinea TaxID=933095 RepID=A0AAI8VGA6_9PEZI|nr:Uu.00g118270.m01.CDS01 [Anthostomella pinea]